MTVCCRGLGFDYESLRIYGFRIGAFLMIIADERLFFSEGELLINKALFSAFQSGIKC